MKLVKSIITGLCCLLLSSCSQLEPDSAFFGFQSVRSVSSYERIYDDSEQPIGSLGQMQVADRWLVCCTGNSECAFSFIDTYNEKTPVHWGTVGNGPGEFVDFGGSVSIVDSMFVFQTRATKSLNFISLFDVVNNNSDIRSYSEKYCYEGDFRPSKVSVMSSGIRLATGCFSDCSVGLVSKDGNPIHTQIDYPYQVDDVPAIFRGTVFQIRTSTQPSGNRFVAIHNGSDVFEIIEAKGESLRRVFLSDYRHVPKCVMRNNRFAPNMDECVNGISNLATNADYVCMSYNGEKMKSKIATSSNELFFFDWNGNKRFKLILPFAIENACLSDSCLFGSCHEGENTCIYKFRF